DMYGLKPDAPAEIRGEFEPINTNVPGIQISEHMPYMAKIMDKCVPLRAVYGSPNGSHDSYICYTGRQKPGEPTGGWPSVGACVSKLLGPTSPDVPPFIGLAPDAGHPPYGSPGLPGFLGIANAAFRPSGPAKKDMVLNGGNQSRLDTRTNLLQQFDSFRKQVDGDRIYDQVDDITAQALGILTSSRLAEAMDLSKEDPATLERYGSGNEARYGDGAPRDNKQFLLARRLVEAGARVVTLNFGRWDFHSNNFSEAKNTHLPYFDQALSALIEDIYQRGLADDVSVVAWGEFGRTPRINKNAGRDHWPAVGGGLIAGGGMRTGQVIGATDKHAAYPIERRTHFGEVIATLYHQMGINPNTVTVPDLTGRPQYLSDHEPMRELI
ncbi:MAG TPA: DUF1501 domain-containing protein, partial [Planctomycetaceae bacterium]|nr:DUF1501 domain-containing protein [Planctomycetaceae bacterium]